jgi:hypothetical protein
MLIDLCGGPGVCAVSLIALVAMTYLFFSELSYSMEKVSPMRLSIPWTLVLVLHTRARSVVARNE